MNVGKYADINWNNDSTLWKKWKEGTTGIPIVDAGMKQLNETGWIHNRIRLIVATTLTKVFHIDWRLGERYFREKLVDYDVTQNVMNWYWVSGETVFSSPYFRIIHPLRQEEKNDKNCEYIQKWDFLTNTSTNKGTPSMKTCHDYSRIKIDIDKNIQESIKIYRRYSHKK